MKFMNQDQTQQQSDIAESGDVKNIAIHVMPERFRSNQARSDQSHKTGLLIIISGLVLVILIAGGAYFYFTKFAKEQVVKTPVNDNKPVAATTPVEPVAATTTEPEPPMPAEEENAALKRYVNFLSQIDAITSLEDYETVLGNFTAQQYISAWKSQKENISKLTEADRSALVGIIKNYKPTRPELESTLSQGNADSQSATLAGLAGISSISITMTKEYDVWKVAGEQGVEIFDENGATTSIDKWISAKLANAAPKPALAASEDADNDGLTDKEEKILATDPSLADSDQDGYSDIKELESRYNPAGAGKLESNPNLKIYQNKTFNYSFYYPTSWTVEKASEGDDSTMFFKSDDNQYFHVLIIPNTDKQEIAEWYKKQMQIDEFDPAREIQAADPAKPDEILWTGIRSEDGLVVYLADDSKEFIYAITYNLGESNKLNYINLFNFSVKNLSLNRAPANPAPAQ